MSPQSVLRDYFWHQINQSPKMASEAIAYHICAFICSLFLLEAGADRFIDHTAVVAKRTGIPPGVLALLTAGAEWEEVSFAHPLSLSLTAS